MTTKVYVRKAMAVEKGGEPRVCIELYMTREEAMLYAMEQPLTNREDAIQAALEEHLNSGHKCSREVKR